MAAEQTLVPSSNFGGTIASTNMLNTSLLTSGLGRRAAV